MRIKRYIKNILHNINYDPKRFWNNYGGKQYFNDFHSEYGQRHENIFLDKIEKYKPNSIIDIGCGYGRYLKAINNNFPDIDLVGVDISKSQIELAKKYCNNSTNINLYEIDGKNIPFELNSFDMSISYGCLMLIPKKDLLKIFEDIRKVTKHVSIFFEYEKPRRHNLFKDKAGYYYHNYDRIFKNLDVKKETIKNWSSDHSVGNTLFTIKY